MENATGIRRFLGKHPVLKLAGVLSVLFLCFGALKQSVSLSKMFGIADSVWEVPGLLPKATIAYAITVTECTSTSSVFLDGAAVLAYSIHKQSIRNAASGSRYDYKLYAFLHEDAVNCSGSLVGLGYKVQVRPTPVNVTEIRGPLKEYVHVAGCCGEKEFLKLYAYTLVDHPIVAHLDADMLLLKPFDDLYDSMLDGPDSPARRRLPTMWTNNTSELPETIDAYFTRDYNMMVPGIRHVNESAVQGGFLVIRPNLTIFEMYQEILMEGDYRPETGWGDSKGLKFGGFYGAAQAQGILCYFYGHVHPETAVELNRCRINSMVDSPFANEEGHEGKCREPVKCEDCRLTNMSDIMAVHYTICQKPWKCIDMNTKDEVSRPLCGAFHNKWFLYRHEMETAWATGNRLYNTTAVRRGRTWVPEEGKKMFCDGEQNKEYIPILYPNRSEAGS